jgi:nitroreductase
MDIIYKRRSIRKFTSRPVSPELINSFIKAGMNAPSAGNEQPWHFVIIDDRNILYGIMLVHPHAEMLETATVAILVCGDLMLETHKGNWPQDCSAATENILLEVTSQGLGAVWCGVYPRESRIDGIRKLLNLPDNIIPFSLIPVGYPAENKSPKNIFDKTRIHLNRW